MAKKIRRQGKSQTDILLDEQIAALDRAKVDVQSGVITPQQYQQRVAGVLESAGGLDKARKARLVLRASEAGVDTARSSGGAFSAGQIVPTRSTRPDLQYVRQSAEFLGEPYARVSPRVRFVPSRTVDPFVQAAQQGAIEGQRSAQQAARVSSAIPKIEAAAGKIRIPGYFGSSPAAVNPEVADAVARLRASTSPKQAAARGREAIKVARGAAASNSGKATVGKGIMAAGGAALLGMIASKAFGKNEVDPQMQMMLAQRLGQSQEGGGDSSRQLMDLSRALTVVKKLQELAAVQGPAAARPRLI